MRLAVIALVLVVAAPCSAQTFRRPVACESCIANWYYYDDSPSLGTSDWNCASSTYDGHRGSDFSLAGGNAAIAAGHDVVAAADGVVVSTVDGHYDLCTTCNPAVDARCGRDFGSGFGNHIVINHGSYRVVYAHLRNGSVRVAPGATVRCGDAIGQIGSSGCTTGAHLHFETRPLGGDFTTAFDPFEGPCSPTSPSRWTSQGAHRSMPAPTCDGTPACPADTYPIWTCNAERTSRRRCIDGVDMTEDCSYGCQSMPVGTDDTCAPPPDADGDGSPAGTDCDDGDAGRFPGNSEVCGDSVDQDCDGSDLACPGVDAGPSPVDAGEMGSDAAIPDQDAGLVPGTDAAVERPRDAGPRANGSLSGTCACRAAGGDPRRRSGIALLAVLVLLTVRRRP